MTRFFLVQRMSYRPKPKDREETVLEKLGNAFGGGRFSDDYVLDYMGSSEFEWGAVPDGTKLIRAAKKPMMDTHTFTHPETGHESTLDFLWRGEDGDPFEAWDEWVRAGARGQEWSYELDCRLKGTTPTWWRDEDHREWECAIYWSLEDGIMWSFHGEGHLHRLLKIPDEAKK